jgi:hypothetical protein
MSADFRLSMKIERLKRLACEACGCGVVLKDVTRMAIAPGYSASLNKAGRSPRGTSEGAQSEDAAVANKFNS